MANNIVEFTELGENKGTFFKQIKNNPDNLPEFVKRYAIDPSADVPKRKTKKNGNDIKIVYEPRTEAKIFKAGLHLIFYGEQILLYYE